MYPAHILVADDDVVARELLAEALRKEGYVVEAFASTSSSATRMCAGYISPSLSPTQARVATQAR